MKGIPFLDKNWAVLLISILLGGAAAWLFSIYLEKKEAEVVAKYSNTQVIKVPVVVATTNLQKGDTLHQSSVAVREIPKDYVAPGALHPSEFAEADGQMLLTSVSAGKPILRSFLPGKGAEQFSDIIADGRRAVTISIDERNSNAGMLVAGDKVDLYLLRETGDNINQIDLLIERVNVLATGRITVDKHRDLVDQIYADPTNYSTVTLDLTTFDAARVTLAKEHGEFVALLRNRRDSQQTVHHSINSGSLFSGTSNPNSGREVEIILGGQGGIATGVQTIVNSGSKALRKNQLASKNEKL